MNESMSSNEEVDRIRMYPFCKRDFPYDQLLEFAKECWSCHQTNVKDTSVLYCNPNITTYPLPLVECGSCNKTAIVISCLYLSFIMVFTVFINSWSIATWVRQMKSGRHRYQTYFKLSLATSDLLYGISVAPFSLFCLIHAMLHGHEEFYNFELATDRSQDGLRSYYETWHALFSPPLIQFAAALLVVTQGASLTSIFLISADRYLALAYSLRYNSIVTTRKCVTAIVVAWSLVIGLGLFAAFAPNDTVSFRAEPGLLFLPIVVATEFPLIYIIPFSLVLLATILLTLWTGVVLIKSERKVKSSSHRKEPFNLRCLFPVRKTTKIPDANLSTSSASSGESVTTTTQMVPENFRSMSAFVDPTQLPVNTVKSKSSSLQDLNKIYQLKTTTNMQQRRIFFQKRIWDEIFITDHRKAILTLLIILSVYIICCLPLGIFILVDFIENPHVDSALYNSSGLVMIFSVALFMSSSLWNSVIYHLRNEDYRKESYKLLKTLFCCVKKY